MTPAAVLSLVNATTGAATGAAKSAAAVAAAGRSRAGGNPDASADSKTANDSAQGFGRHLRDEQGRRLAKQASTAEATRPAASPVRPGEGTVAVGAGGTAAGTVAAEGTGRVPNAFISNEADDGGPARTLAGTDLHRVDGLAAPADPVGRARSRPLRHATRDAGSRSAGDAASSDTLNPMPIVTVGDARGQGPVQGSDLGQDAPASRRSLGKASAQPAARESGPAQRQDARTADMASDLEDLPAETPKKAHRLRTAGPAPSDSANAAGLVSAALAEPSPSPSAPPSTTRPVGPTGSTTASGLLADNSATADALRPTGPANPAEVASGPVTSRSGAASVRTDPPSRNLAEASADQPAKSRHAAPDDATRTGPLAFPAQAAAIRSALPHGTPEGPGAAEPRLKALTSTAPAATRAVVAVEPGAIGAPASDGPGIVAALPATTAARNDPALGPDTANPAGILASSRTAGGASAAETAVTSRPRGVATSNPDAGPTSGAGPAITPGAAVMPGQGEASAAVPANRLAAASTTAAGTSAAGPARATSSDSAAAVLAATGSRAASGNDALSLANHGLGQPSAPAAASRSSSARTGGAIAGLPGAAASAGAGSSPASLSPWATAVSSPSGGDSASLANDRANALLASQMVIGNAAPSAGSDGTGASMAAALSASSRSDGALAAATYVAVAGDMPSVTVPTPIDSPFFAASLASQVSLLTRDGIERAEVRLNPAEMGPVQVRIQVDGREARVEFSADMAATRQILETSLPQLASSLREAGFTLSGGGVFQQPSSERQAGGSNEPGQGRSGGHEQRPGRGTSGDDGGLAGTAGMAMGAAQRQRVAAATGRLDLYA